MYSYFLIIAICLTIFGIIYTFLTYRNKERITLIESGLDIEAFKKNIQRQNILLLHFGLIFIGFSFGVFCGFFLEKYLLIHHNPKQFHNYPQAYISMIALFMGMGMLISFITSRRLNKK